MLGVLPVVFTILNTNSWLVLLVKSSTPAPRPLPAPSPGAGVGIGVPRSFRKSVAVGWAVGIGDGRGAVGGSVAATTRKLPNRASTAVVAAPAPNAIRPSA